MSGTGYIMCQVQSTELVAEPFQLRGLNLLMKKLARLTLPPPGGEMAVLRRRHRVWALRHSINNQMSIPALCVTYTFDRQT
jgi:hypothetical protein